MKKQLLVINFLINAFLFSACSSKPVVVEGTAMKPAFKDGDKILIDKNLGELKRGDVINFLPQKELNLYYRGRLLDQKYKPDFICYDKIIVEIKAVQKLIDEHRAQVMNYLKATGFELGLLVNFGHYPKLEYERIAWTKTKRR